MVGRSPLIKPIINKGSVARNVISGMSKEMLDRKNLQNVVSPPPPEIPFVL